MGRLVSEFGIKKLIDAMGKLKWLANKFLKNGYKCGGSDECEDHMDAFPHRSQQRNRPRMKVGFFIEENAVKKGGGHASALDVEGYSNLCKDEW